MDLSPPQRRALLDISRSVIRAILARQTIQIPAPADKALASPAGAFVSLHELQTHRLRGCVGRLDATIPLFHAVAAASKSVLEDPRFTNFRVRNEDLPHLSIEISITWPLRPASDVLDFDLNNDGIYLSLGGRAGCFLPQVARETGWNKEQLLARLSTEKLGLAPDAWKSPEASLQKFATLLIGPEPFVTIEPAENDTPKPAA
jgi:AmmeMemoRadiSam system protein A